VVRVYISLLACRFGGFPKNIVTITLIATVFVGTTSLGGFLGPLLGGILYDKYGFQKASIFLFTLYLVLVSPWKLLVEAGL
jgi:hypothetical protein